METAIGVLSSLPKEGVGMAILIGAIFIVVGFLLKQKLFIGGGILILLSGLLVMVFPTIYLFAVGLPDKDKTATPSPPPTKIIENPGSEELFPYAMIGDVPACDFEEIKHHCIYYVEENINDYQVAIWAYGDTQWQGKVKEFYRDKNGEIPVWGNTEAKLTLIPPLEMNLDLYTKYFALLGIEKCNEDAILKPCWIEAKIKSYQTLASEYYGNISKDNIDCLKNANKTEYDGNGLKSIDIEVGDVIVLPICE